MSGRSDGPRTRRVGSEGFSLIEVLVALVVFTVAALGIAAGMVVAMSSDTHAGEQSRATALAVQEMERMKTLPPDQIVSQAPTSVNALGEEDTDGRYVRWVDVEDQAAGENTKGVTVYVEYGAGGRGTQTVDLYTIIYTGTEQ